MATLTLQHLPTRLPPMVAGALRQKQAAARERDGAVKERA